MSNRTLIYMTIVVLLGMAILLILNLTTIFSGQTEPQTYLKYNEVKGMAVEHNHLIYTLSFEQQNQMIEFLNESIPITEIPSNQSQNPHIEKIIIYRFGNQENLILTPVAYMNNQLVYSAPLWNSKGYMLDVSEGQLQHLLDQTYDH